MRILMDVWTTVNDRIYAVWMSVMQWDWLNDHLRAVLNTLYYTPMGEFLRTSTWAWPLFESLHFTGMSLLAGTIVMFDLRLLGFARAVPVHAMHRLIPFGIFGIIASIVGTKGFAAFIPLGGFVSIPGMHRPIAHDAERRFARAKAEAPELAGPADRVGRSLEADVVCQDRLVSRMHARLLVREDGCNGHALDGWYFVQFSSAASSSAGTACAS